MSRTTLCYKSHMPSSRQGSIRIFRLAGIDVFLHWSWLLLAVYGTIWADSLRLKDVEWLPAMSISEWYAPAMSVNSTLPASTH